MDQKCANSALLFLSSISGVGGNEAADAEAKGDHVRGIIVPLPFVASDGNTVIRKIETTLTKRL